MITKNTFFEKIKYYKNNKRRMDAIINRVRIAGAKVGNNVALYNVHIDDNFPFLVEIGNNVTITGATLICHDASNLVFEEKIRIGSIIIRDNCFIGYGAILLPSVKIGPNTIVGAGSVCTKDIAPGVVVAGNPAKKICNLEDLLKRHSERTLKIDWPLGKVPEDAQLMKGIEKVYRISKEKN